MREGTGTLKGFHASVDVTYVSGADSDWDGTYLFDCLRRNIEGAGKQS